MSWRRHVVTFVLLLASVAASGCIGAAARAVRPLPARWAFHPGDDPRWALPSFDDHDWARLEVPKSWGRQGYADLTGLAWYRVRVPVTPDGDPVGVTIGKVGSAYELYADGVRLGGVGRLPPQAAMEYDRHRTYQLRPRAGQDAVVLAMRVWRAPGTDPSAGGPMAGPFLVGPLLPLMQSNAVAETDHLVLAIVFLLAGLYHLGLWYLRPKSVEYGWFGLVALLAASYGLLLTQWKYTLVDDFMLLKRIEHVMLYVMPAVVLEYWWRFFKQPRPLWLRGLQALLAAGAIAVVASPGLGVALMLLPKLEIIAALTGALCLALAWRRWRADGSEAGLVGLGMLVLASSVVHDALAERNWFVGPRLDVYGFLALLVAMSVSLAMRFDRALVALDEMSHDLERRVRDRTAELAHAYRQMEELALHDSLTGLLNRRAIEDRARAELARARRHGAPCSVVLLDVDHFKAINDTHGHATGDLVLAAAAAALRAAVRESDDVGRWGGEEFMVVLPDADRNIALAAAERLRRAIECTHPGLDGRSCPVVVTASIGTATLHADGAMSFDQLVQQADLALYRAKQAGRNRVCAA